MMTKKTLILSLVISILSCKKEKNPEFEGCAIKSMETEVIGIKHIETYFYNSQKQVIKVSSPGTDPVVIEYNTNTIEVKQGSSIILTSKLDVNKRIVSEESVNGYIRTYQYNTDGYLEEEVITGPDYYWQKIMYKWSEGNMIEKIRKFETVQTAPADVRYSKTPFLLFPNGSVYDLFDVANPYIISYYGKMPKYLPEEMQQGDFLKQPVKLEYDDDNRVNKLVNGGYTYKFNHLCN